MFPGIQNGIVYTFFRLEPLGVNFGDTTKVEALSYEVYQFIINQPEQFEIVHFDANSGAGYYTILAQKQGLICSETRFVASLDGLNPSEIERLTKGSVETKDHVITDVNALKKDYIVQKSVELAV